MEPKMTVIGSCNVDLIAYTDSMPKIGQTVKGNRFKKGFGGKGANQAVAAARLGAKVSMVGKLGKDSYGKETLINFQENKVNTDFLFVEEDENVSSGLAPIWVDSKGNNSIIIVPGTNDLITKEEMEIPTEITLEGMKIAKQEGSKVILNPAPAHETISDSMYSLCDIVCPNETELEALTGKPVISVQDAEIAAKDILAKGVKTVIVTLGSQGSLLVTSEQAIHVPVEIPVKAIDTTGAGDCFIGSLVYFLAVGKPIVDAMKRANYVASLSVQKEGTQTSYPHRNDLPDHLFA